MASYEDIEQLIEEWFTDYYSDYKMKGIIKLYSKIQIECEKNIDYFVNEDNYKEEQDD